MDIAIIGSLIGLGYYFNKDGLDRNKYNNSDIKNFLENHEKKLIIQIFIIQLKHLK